MSLPPFSSLLEAHGSDVHRFLVASAGPHDGADCYQETVLAALRAYPRLSHGQNLRGWLFTIAHRKVVDAARVRQREPVPVAAPPERSVVDPQHDGVVWEAVRRLPAGQRTAVLQRFLFDRPYREIAEIVGCSEGAARQRVHDGLERLRQEVER